MSALMCLVGGCDACWHARAAPRPAKAAATRCAVARQAAAAAALLVAPGPQPPPRATGDRHQAIPSCWAAAGPAQPSLWCDHSDGACGLSQARHAPSALTDLAARGRGLAGARVQELATERGKRLPEHGNTAGRGAAASGEGGIAASGPDYRIAASPCAATPCPRAVAALRSLQPHCTAADHAPSARSPCRDSWRPQPSAAPWPAACRRRGALPGVAP